MAASHGGNRQRHRPQVTRSGPDGPWGREPHAGLQVTCCRARVRRTVTAADRRLGSGVDAAEPPGGDPDQD